MKIRTGFVSNSSSSSFLIYGIFSDEVRTDDPVDISRIANAYLKLWKPYLDTASNWTKERLAKIEESLSKFLADSSDDEGLRCLDTYEMLSELPADLGGYSPAGYGDWYFGASWSSIGDNETGAEFKERIREDLKPLLALLNMSAADVHTYSYAWYS